MRFTEEEYARAREANQDREELQAAQDEAASLRSQLARAEAENETLKAAIVWAARSVVCVDESEIEWGAGFVMETVERERTIYKTERYDGTDADLIRAAIDASRRKEADRDGDR